MAWLPEAHRAIIVERKITRYLLSSGHPAGRAKAVFFQRFGFSVSEWRRSQDALLEHARTVPVARVSDTKFGKKYILEGPLRAPDVGCRGFGRSGRGARRCYPKARYDLPNAQCGAMIKELDPVVLTENRAECRLEAGDVGWVVMVHDGGAGYEVEFVTLAGETVTVVTLPAGAVRAVRPKEIAHARMVA